MELERGTRLGDYQIVELIGRGGMGVVYRARDTKLGRDVALKTLSAEFSRDEARISRLEREAHILASLNHPGIATLLGVEESDEAPFLVMELVEGKTLAELMAGSGMSLDRVLLWCEQIAKALEAAHSMGVLHRDLKPANIMVRADGTVKLLDFGLAKWIVAAADSDASTLAREGTAPGSILGTAAYMSPEQARGQALDERTDVWAFACVLFELLTGKPPFLGKTVSDTVAQILKEEPDWTRLPRSTPESIRRLLRRALEKDPSRRTRHIGDTLVELQDADSIPAVAPAQRDAQFTRWLPWLVGLVAVVIAVTRSPEPLAVDVGRFIIPARVLAVEDSASVALSPDGTTLAYVGIEEGKRHLFLRPIDTLDARPLSELDEPADPFFSPDGKWIAFFADGKLKKISVGGGAPVTLSNAGANGGSWRENRIAFSLQGPGPIAEIDEAGGEPLPITRPDFAAREFVHAWPELLPGGRALLFTVLDGALRPLRIVLRRIDTGEETTLIENARQARYLKSGHLVYSQGDELLGVRFDLKTLSIHGAPVELIDGVLDNIYQGAQFTISDSGSLAYVLASIDGVPRKLAWVGRAGEEELLQAFDQRIAGPRLSPTGEQIAVWLLETTQAGVLDLQRGALTPLPTAGGNDSWPLFTPDGQSVVVGSDGFGRGAPGVFLRRADGTGDVRRLTEAVYPEVPCLWTPDGRILLFLRGPTPETGFDILRIDLETKRVTPVLDTSIDEKQPALSSDGEWLAYVADDSGRNEVYVTSFPKPQGRIQVSVAGGQEPLWAPSGHVLYFRSLDGESLFAVDDDGANGFRPSPPRRLFEGRAYRPGVPYGRNYDIAPDGEHFVMIPDVALSAWPSEVHFVLNWIEEVKRLLPR